MVWKFDGSLVFFNFFQVKGLLSKNKLLIQNIDIIFLGGILKGSWLLDWSNGLVMVGEGSLIRVDCCQVSVVFVFVLKLEGDFGGVL